MRAIVAPATASPVGGEPVDVQYAANTIPADPPAHTAHATGLTDSVSERSTVGTRANEETAAVGEVTVETASVRTANFEGCETTNASTAPKKRHASASKTRFGILCSCCVGGLARRQGMVPPLPLVGGARFPRAPGLCRPATCDLPWDEQPRLCGLCRSSVRRGRWMGASPTCTSKKSNLFARAQSAQDAQQIRGVPPLWTPFTQRAHRACARRGPFGLT